MTPGALDYLADCFDPRAPGLAAVLRNWALVIEHNLLAVARESLAALAGAQQLAVHVPDDAAHRESAEVLEFVFLSVARAVFARDARRPVPMSEQLTRLAAIAHQATTYSHLPNLTTTLRTLQHHLKDLPGDDAATARTLVTMALDSVLIGIDPVFGEPELRALCAAIGAVLERPGLRAENERLRAEPTLDTDDAAEALGAEEELVHAG